MKKNIEVIILAGGKGARMGELTCNQQKCLLEIEGEPLLHWIFEALLTAFGSISAKVAVSHQETSVKDFLDKKYLGSSVVDLEYVPHPAGAETLGAYKTMVEKVRGEFVGLPGDLLATSQTYQDGLKTHLLQNNDLTLTLTPELDLADNHGLVKTTNQKVDELIWPPQGCSLTPPLYRDTNIYFGTTGLLSLVEHFSQTQKAFTTFVQYLLAQNLCQVGNYISPEPFTHVAYPSDLLKGVPR